MHINRFATSPHRNIATSQHRTFATSQHRTFATSQHSTFATLQHRIFATSQHRTFATSQHRTFATSQHFILHIRNIAHPQYRSLIASRTPTLILKTRHTKSDPTLSLKDPHTHSLKDLITLINLISLSDTFTCSQCERKDSQQ
jgi:hypothetical protein